MDRAAQYETVTAEVIRQIEEGAGVWRMPWQSLAEAGQPMNALTGVGYRGGNHLTLGLTAAARGWSGHWSTYKQWISLGAQVRRGERATHLIKWTPVDDLATARRRMIPSAFAVFAAEQVDGWQAPEPTPRNTPERIIAAEALLGSLGADVRHGGNAAAYSPVGDWITLPHLEQFEHSSDYYATSLHEHAHWTGHRSRLGRDLSGRFGSDSYAAEELVAELSAAFSCARLGISTTPRPDHAAYIASWLRVLRADSSALFHAATKAQAATDYIASISPSPAAVGDLVDAS